MSCRACHVRVRRHEARRSSHAAKIVQYNYSQSQSFELLVLVLLLLGYTQFMVIEFSSDLTGMLCQHSNSQFLMNLFLDVIGELSNVVTKYLCDSYLHVCRFFLNARADVSQNSSIVSKVSCGTDRRNQQLLDQDATICMERQRSTQKSDEKLPTSENLSARTEYRKHLPVFCFRHLCEKDKDFPLSAIQKAKDFCVLLKQLKVYSHQTWAQIELIHDNHAHDLNWEDTCKNRFPDECRGFPPYQFAASQSFRVIGYHNEGKFHIVWLDPNHKMWTRT